MRAIRRLLIDRGIDPDDVLYSDCQIPRAEGNASRDPESGLSRSELAELAAKFEADREPSLCHVSRWSANARAMRASRLSNASGYRLDWHKAGGNLP